MTEIQKQLDGAINEARILGRLLSMQNRLDCLNYLFFPPAAYMRYLNEMDEQNERDEEANVDEELQYPAQELPDVVSIQPCPRCGKALEAYEDTIGEEVKCPDCGEVFEARAEQSGLEGFQNPYVDDAHDRGISRYSEPPKDVAEKPGQVEDDKDPSKQMPHWKERLYKSLRERDQGGPMYMTRMLSA